jgi:hypothetical protein
LDLTDVLYHMELHLMENPFHLEVFALLVQMEKNSQQESTPKAILFPLE